MDILQLRRDTPGVQHVNHLLASGSALMPRCVSDAVIDYIGLESVMGGYEAAAQEEQKLERIYDSVASLIGADRTEIALLENATAAWCHAFYALALKPGQRILTCEAEYAANYVAFLQRAKRDGVTIDVIPSDESGALDVDALESMIDESVGLIAITWIPTNGGLVNPAAAVGKVAGRHGIPYLLDACQAVGQMPVNVQELGCDFLSATGRKFLRGPRGTGFLYVRKALIETLEPCMIDHFAAPWVARDQYQLRDDARRFENWENAYALRAGLGASVDYAMSLGVQAIQDRIRMLADSLREQIVELPGGCVLDLGDELCGIVSFTVDGLDPQATVVALQAQEICIGSSSPESTRLDSQRRGLQYVMRAAPHVYNTDQDIEQVCSVLAELTR